MRRGLAGLALLALAAGPARADEPAALVNRDFEEWKDGVPAGWSVVEGARRGNGPPSTIARLDGGGVRLAADAATRAFMLLEQSVEVDPAATYRLSYELRFKRGAGDIPLGTDPYVGLAFADAKAPRGKGLRFEVPTRAQFVPGEIVIRGPASPISVRIFLPYAGTLELRRLSLDRLAPASSFDVLVRSMDLRYAHFEGKDADWAERVAAARRAIAHPEDSSAFVAAARDFLAPLRDEHIWIRRADGQLVGTHAPSVPPGPDFSAIAKRLLGAKPIANVALAGELEPGIGYLAIGSLQLDAATFDAIALALDRLLGGKGLVLDLRVNMGGEERFAIDLCSRLCDAPMVYAKRKYRNGPGHADFGDAIESRIRPREGKPSFAGPVAALIGPGNASSGEGFAQMLAALPRAKLFGLPTRGASGNPQPIDLPNGVSVWFSRWVDFLPDGTPLEGRGVPPTVRVEPRPGADAALDAALADLRERISK